MQSFLHNKTFQSFLQSLRTIKRGLLILDYDGTLAPFKKERQKAVMHPLIKKEIQQLLHMKETRIIILSGRSVDALIPLLHLSPLPEIWGCHGLERRSKHGKLWRDKISPLQRQGLQLAKTVLVELPCSLIEVKPFSVAVHTRPATPKQKKELKNLLKNCWSEIATHHDLEILSFNGGWELRVKEKNKSTAMRKILLDVPWKCPVAYLGDDKTDEDAFRALGDRGLKVLVGKKSRLDHKELRIATYPGVASFLRQWRLALT